MNLFVCNTVRLPRTRQQRMATGFRHRFKQIICGGSLRLLRNQSAPLKKELFDAYHAQLAEQQAGGAIEVRRDGPNGPALVVVKTEDEKDGVKSVSYRFDVGDLPAEPKVVEPEKVEEPQEAVEEAAEEDDDDEEVEEVDIDRMRKDELVEFAAEHLELDAAELAKLTKAEIKEMLL